MKTHYTISVLILSLTLFTSCMDESRDFQKFDYNSEDYPDPLAESPYHVEDYHILKKTLDLPQVPFTYTLNLPEYMKSSRIVEKEISDNRATLGRVLFYDKSLSKNESISCESCHRQAIAFSDNQKLSVGFRGEETKRNSMPLGSAVSMSAYHGPSRNGWVPFLWDYKAWNVSQVSKLAITSPIEMGTTLEDVVEKIKSKAHYFILFKAAFGDSEINERRLLSGLQSFVDGIGSYESKFDEAMIAANGDIQADFSSFTKSENRGKKLYSQNCGICHGEKLVRTIGPANIGLDKVSKDEGIQYYEREDIGEVVGAAFKVPPLRNVALTAPYMHDGRFESLEEVVEFYSTGIQDNKDISWKLKDLTNSTLKFNFTEQEKTDLVSFLGTLTDDKFLTYEKYADPFK